MVFSHGVFMLGFTFKIAFPLAILLSPLGKVSSESPLFSYGTIIFALAWLFWGSMSLLRSTSSNKQGKTRKTGMERVLEGVPSQYAVLSNHDILGVSKEASKGEIEAAYQAKMASFNPERIAKMGKSVQQEIKTKQERINTAYKALMEQ